MGPSPSTTRRGNGQIPRRHLRRAVRAASRLARYCTNKTARPLSFDIIQLLKLPIEGNLAVTKGYLNPIRFSSVQRRKVEAAFSGGAITGNGGIPLPDVEP